MKNIAIVLFFLSIISAGFAVYSFDFAKNIVLKNLLGQADVFSDSFQFVGEVDLESGQKNQLSTSDVDSAVNRSKSTKKSTKSAVNNQPVVTSKISADIIDTGVVAATNIVATTTTNIEATTGIAETTAGLLTTSIATTTSAGMINIATSPEPSDINASNHIIISEVLAGVDGNLNYEFIELYNPNSNAVDLIGWSIKKRSSTGKETTLVSASRFDGKKIMPKKYFLLANEGGYNGVVQSDIVWPKSYALAYKNNAIILYNANGEAIEDIGWDEIAKGQSLERVFNGNDWDKGEFKIQNNPNPQNFSY